MDAQSPQTVKVLAVDDEPLALKQLESYIAKVPGLEPVALCRSAREALPWVGEVDLMFLDIQMPDLSGLDFVRSLERPPLLVFTTAYPEYAVEGFRVQAIDYLLKPFGFKEFEKAVGRARKILDLLGLRDAAIAAKQDARPLFFKTDRRVVPVTPDRIRYVESMSEYMKVYLTDAPDPLVILGSLKNLIGQLPKDRFMRIHRSYIVALSQIREATVSSVILDGGVTLPVGSLYRAEFKEYLAR